LLGGFVDEATGALGSEAIEELDIRFARNARRLQRATKEGIYRLCQIDLAYMNLDPDPTLFDVHMGETSTAEEEAIRESLDTGVDTIDKFINVAENAVGEGKLDKKKMFDYFSRKILRLEDFHIEDFILADPDMAPVMESKENVARALAVEEGIKRRIMNRRLSANTDLCSFVPVVWEADAKGSVVPAPWYKESNLVHDRIQENWQEMYGDAVLKEVTDEEADEEAEEVGD